MHMDAQVKGGLCLLDKVRQENARLKDTLSDLVQLDISRYDIDYAEYYQQRFLEIDQVVDLLRHDMINFLIKVVNRHVPIELPLTYTRFSALKRNVFEVKGEFDLLRERFETYIHQIQAGHA